jgi:protein-tyrosine phosphatase
MFHFIRKKAFLRDLIPQNHVDIHSHLLPGIDDGAATVEDTLLLTNALRDFGVDQCITTPHIMKNVWDNTKESISDAYTIAVENLKEPNNFSLRFAAEYLMDANFAALFLTEPLLTLKGNLVLVEISYLNPPFQLYEIIFDLQVAGYQPVLAHPERYIYFHHNFHEYEKLKNSGCLLQLNLLSTIGYYGENVAKISEKLLKKGMIDFVGSDVHHENHILGFSKNIIIKEEQALKEAIQKNQFFRI